MRLGLLATAGNSWLVLHASTVGVLLVEHEDGVLRLLLVTQRRSACVLDARVEGLAGDRELGDDGAHAGCQCMVRAGAGFNGEVLLFRHPAPVLDEHTGEVLAERGGGTRAQSQSTHNTHTITRHCETRRLNFFTRYKMRPVGRTRNGTTRQIAESALKDERSLPRTVSSEQPARFFLPEQFFNAAAMSVFFSTTERRGASRSSSCEG